MSNFALPGSFEEMEVDFGSTFENEEQVTAPEFPKEGIYHFSLADVDAANAKVPGAAFLRFEIITGNEEGQEGKCIRYPVWPPNENSRNPESAYKQWMKTVLQVMLALGVRKSGEFPKVQINQDFWNRMEGRQCMGNVTHVEETRTADSGKKFSFTNAVFANRTDLMPLFHPDLSGIPYDKAAAELAGYVEEGGESEGI